MATSFEDVTARMQMEKALKESEKQYREIVEATKAGIYEIDFINDRFTYVNDVMCELTGWSREELLNMGPSTILTEKSLEDWAKRWDALNKGQHIPETFEYEARIKDGSIICTLVTAQYKTNEDDMVIGARVIAIDITEAKRIKMEARQKEEVIFNELENRIKVTKVKHYDAHNHRIDRIERCLETEILEREIFSLGLFDPTRNTAWSRFIKIFLLYENGEAGVMCPVACTHGAVELMQKFEDSLSFEAKEILNHIRDGRRGEYARGAQFVSEIQGGSDVPANLVEAVFQKEEGSDGYSNCWRIYGQKFFCSAMHADYAVVTAKPIGVQSSTRVAAFIVPSWLPGNKEKEIRNSFTIDRLKQKLGTAELPTAEITYDGAVAYPIGPLEKGLALIVGIVLSLSRLHVAF